MEIVWLVFKYNKTIGRLHTHHHFYKACATKEKAQWYVDEMNKTDEKNNYYYHSEMVR